MVAWYKIAMQATVGATQVNFWFGPTQPSWTSLRRASPSPSPASLPTSRWSLIAAACGVAGAFVGKAKEGLKVWARCRQPACS